MGEAHRTSEARMRAAAQDVVSALDRHGDALNRVEGITVLGTVLGTYALAWGGEAEVVNGAAQVAWVLVEQQRAKLAHAAEQPSCRQQDDGAHGDAEPPHDPH